MLAKIFACGGEGGGHMSRPGSDARGTTSTILAFFRRHTRIGLENQRLTSDVRILYKL
jgi:hypothetical protein